MFRSQGVTIGGTDYVPPNSVDLPLLFDTMVKRANATSHVQDKAVRVFLDCARNQYFYDGNKRTGQLLMNGLLLSDGQGFISIPARLALDYNSKMVLFYDTGEDSEIRGFLMQCQLQTY